MSIRPAQSTTTRVYVVTELATKREHLVRASMKNNAARHIAGQQYQARFASQDDLERLIGAGQRVQLADERHHADARGNGHAGPEDDEDEQQQDDDDNSSLRP